MRNFMEIALFCMLLLTSAPLSTQVQRPPGAIRVSVGLVPIDVIVTDDHDRPVTDLKQDDFDEAFFAYREDVDLAWRAQWLGWRCLYVPEARGFHVRRVLPERRALLPAEINMHSFKNRFLLRIKNMDAGTYARFLLPITARDAAALAYVVLREPSSLRAFSLLFKALPRARDQRREMRARHRLSPQEMRSWFSNQSVSKPAN